jgi:transposase-like protein
MSEIKIITDGGRRRHWSAADKLRIVEETFDHRASVSAVARRHGVAPNLSCDAHPEWCNRDARHRPPGRGLQRKSPALGTENALTTRSQVRSDRHRLGVRPNAGHFRGDLITAASSARSPIGMSH